jgi:hypothetical protein
VNWFFLTFGGGDLRYRAMARRLAKQAKSLDSVIPVAVTDATIHRVVRPEIAREIEEYASRQPKAYGFWYWKPLLIQEFLAQPDASGVIYADSGCELNLTDASVRKFRNWLEMAEVDGHRMWTVEGPWTDRMYTKRSLLNQFEFNTVQLDAPQVQSTVLILAKTPGARTLVDEWVRLARLGDHSLLDNSLGGDGPEDPSFVAHRYDQSILSCLVKREGWPVHPNEMHFDWAHDRERGHDLPIWSVRNRRVLSIHAPAPLRGLESVAARGFKLAEGMYRSYSLRGSNLKNVND